MAPSAYNMAAATRLAIEHAQGRGHAVTPHGALDVPRHRTPDVRGGTPSLHRCQIWIIGLALSARRRGANVTGTGQRM